MLCITRNCNILEVKNTLVKSVNYVTRYKFAVLLLFIFYHYSIAYIETTKKVEISNVLLKLSLQ